MSAEVLYQALLSAEVELAIALPDSLLHPLCALTADRGEIPYLQCCDEATAIGVAAGATLAGTRTLVLMENSGLRRACETLSRFVLSHRLHVAMLISHRGGFGEPNWWGLAHSETMPPLLEMLRIRTEYITRDTHLADALRNAYAMLRTGQCSVALVAERSVLAAN
ncbi:hypothetical protein [Actinomadura bangladeshensis]|uniref:Uncharacterized protein n=1 Tax=Actinomadura bangladeshensis TaxID=453573 RepID=A0A4R4NNG7_9ACTN|nr:hypothetical protein [Actinomadura bangladeshensis]TDC09393.1 hypothetical protein E1284_29600 [Actinomadura bangladeshensis]